MSVLARDDLTAHHKGDSRGVTFGREEAEVEVRFAEREGQQQQREKGGREGERVELGARDAVSINACATSEQQAASGDDIFQNLSTLLVKQEVAQLPSSPRRFARVRARVGRKGGWEGGRESNQWTPSGSHGPVRLYCDARH
eukprot:536055-Rhodomonas_salina.7